MKALKKIALLLALTLCLTTVLGACAFAEDTAAPEATATPVPEVVMATVNGAAVMTSDVQAQLDYLNDYYTSQGYDVTLEQNAAVLRQFALEAAVQELVLHQQAEALGFAAVSDEDRAQVEADVAKEWTEAVDYYAANFGMTADASDEEKASARTSALALLESNGFTEDSLVEQALNNLWYEKLYAYAVKDAALADGAVENYFNQQVEQDKAAYENNISSYEIMTQYYGSKSYYVPEGYRGISHILLPVDEALITAYNNVTAQLEEQIEAVETGSTATAAPDATADPDATAAPAVTQADVDAAYDAIIASVQPTIDEIMDKLNNQHVDFLSLVDEYGTDPGMAAEPQRTAGYPVHMDSMVWDPAFTKGAFTMEKVGDVSKPIVSSFGVHIMQYTSDIPAGPIALTDELRAEITEKLMSDAESTQFNTQMDAWMNAAVIAYTEDAASYLPETTAAPETTEAPAQ